MGVSSEERIGIIQNHEDILAGTEPMASSALPAEQAVFLSDFEFQVYLASQLIGLIDSQYRRK